MDEVKAVAPFFASSWKLQWAPVNNSHEGLSQSDPSSQNVHTTEAMTVRPRCMTDAEMDSITAFGDSPAYASVQSNPVVAFNSAAVSGEKTTEA
eukprot:5901649-Pleurochrysis_carterae.AAC.1